MTSKYVTALYGHPQQIMPSHIVITSPYFDTRDIKGLGFARKGTSKKEWEDRREMIVRLRGDGILFRDIAAATGISLQAVWKTHDRYKRSSLHKNP